MSVGGSIREAPWSSWWWGEWTAYLGPTLYTLLRHIAVYQLHCNLSPTPLNAWLIKLLSNPSLSGLCKVSPAKGHYYIVMLVLCKSSDFCTIFHTLQISNGFACFKINKSLASLHSWTKKNISYFSVSNLFRGVRGHRQKTRKNSVKLGKNAKNRLKMKEKAEILGQNFCQKWGNQLKRGTFTPCLFLFS